ncbi:hypothetical protein AB4305_05980 [Nocardia sp. 2YAB30]|uniref:hypothetical protein n=1 Tax=unclassified Nocardia TaxID=2637762 RepID=UPI003F9DF7E7
MRSIISNIGDCFADPGELTRGEAQRALSIHNICSQRCLVLQQAERILGVDGRERSSIGELSPEQKGESRHHSAGGSTEVRTTIPPTSMAPTATELEMP